MDHPSEANLDSVGVEAAQFATRLTASLFPHLDEQDRSGLKTLRTELRRFINEPTALSLRTVRDSVANAYQRFTDLGAKAETQPHGDRQKTLDTATDFGAIASMGAEFLAAVEQKGIVIGSSHGGPAEAEAAPVP